MKTQLRYLKDGAVEVLRLFSPDELEGYEKDDPLLYEKSIVWLEDQRAFPFLRVKVIRMARSRRGPIYLGEGGRVVGYSKLTPNAPRCGQANGYVRRVFYLTTEDLADLSGPVPPAACDPKSLLPGIPGLELCPART